MISMRVVQLTVVALLVSLMHCQPPGEQASLDDLIKEIFTSEPPNGKPSDRGPETYGSPNTPTDNHITNPSPHAVHPPEHTEHHTNPIESDDDEGNVS